MPSMEQTHVYVTDPETGVEKYFGFFMGAKGAADWVAKQADPTMYRISDKAPDRSTP